LPEVHADIGSRQSGNGRQMQKDQVLEPAKHKRTGCVAKLEAAAHPAIPLATC